MFELVSVRVLSSVFATLLFVGFVHVRHVTIGQEISYSKISKTVSFFIWVPLVLELQNIFWSVCKVQFDDKFTSNDASSARIPSAMGSSATHPNTETYYIIYIVHIILIRIHHMVNSSVHASLFINYIVKLSLYIAELRSI